MVDSNSSFSAQKQQENIENTDVVNIQSCSTTELFLLFLEFYYKCVPSLRNTLVR